MKKDLSILWDLTMANIKMFIRDRSALFWSLFFPILMIGIFGLLDFTNMSNNNVGLVYDESTEQYAKQLQEIFKKNQDYKFHTGTLDEELKELENDNRMIVIEFTTEVVSSNEAETAGQTETSEPVQMQMSPEEALALQNEIVVNTYIGKKNEQGGQIMSMITEKVLSDIAVQSRQLDLGFEVNDKVINTHNLRYIDFIVPGIIALAIMQGALFGVVGTIVVNREKGILKRIFATPLPRSTFLISTIISRTVISLAQIAILLALSYLVFQVKIVGSLALVAGISLLGSLAFIAMALLFSGFAKTAEAARAMVMPVQMLLMFTSGVYFDRSVLPTWLFEITKFLPLTYLADALRDVMTKGYTLGDRSIQIAIVGLTVWLVVLVIAAIRTFKWEIQ